MNKDSIATFHLNITKNEIVNYTYSDNVFTPLAKSPSMDEFLKNVTIFDHPLIKHKVSHLRDVHTGSKEFCEIVNELSMLMGYEALADLPTEEIEIETPLEKCLSTVIAGRKLAVVPILRAGLGMVDGLLSLVPTAKVGHIGMYRDETTHEPVEYYCKLPRPIEERVIVVTDPMLATGGSACDAIRQIKLHGGRKIKFMCIIAAPEGLSKLQAAHPDVDIYVASVDESKKSEDLKGKTYHELSIVVGNKATDPVTASALALVEGVLLDTESSPLRRALLDAHIGSGISGNFVSDILQPIFSIRASGSDLEQKDKFISTIYKTLQDINAGIAPRTAQNHADASYVTMLDKSMSPIDWNKTPREVNKWICGLQPWPVATAEINGETFRIFKAEYTENKTEKSAGSIVSAGKKGIEFACANGETLLITELQAPGKKRMKASDYLLGHPIRLED